MIFSLPTDLIELAHFSLPRVQTWGRKDDAAYKARVCEAAAIVIEDMPIVTWYVFCIRCLVGKSRGRYERQIPDVENIPKLIVDAFTGILYPDDNLKFVRGVQVEAEWCEDEDEMAEIWIYGHLAK